MEITLQNGHTDRECIEDWLGQSQLPHLRYRIYIRLNQIIKETRGATTFSKLGVQFLGVGYYYLSTEKIDRSAQFGAVGYIISLFIKKLCKKSGGPSKFWGGPDPLPQTPSGCAHERNVRFQLAQLSEFMLTVTGHVANAVL